jgi:hypothetical protein
MPTPGVLDPNRSQIEVQLYKEEPAREVIHQSTISLAFSSPLPNKLTFSLIYLIYPHYYEMQSTLVALLAVLAAGVSAAPLNSIFDRATCDVKSMYVPANALCCLLLNIFQRVSLLSSHPSRRHATPRPCSWEPVSRSTDVCPSHC